MTRTKSPSIRSHTHLYAVGRYTWCRRAWMTRRNGRDRRKLVTTDIEHLVTCPDCLAAMAAVALQRSTLD